MSDVLRELLAALSDEDFERLYGPLARLEPPEAAEVLAGIEVPWWIVGGWAIEAFTGVSRTHEDVDVCILAKDLPAAVEVLLDSQHVWAVGSGAMSPMLSPEQPFPPWAGQLWTRREATEPWLLDINVAPDHNGRWMFKRDETVVLDLEDTIWLGDDGIRYQRPEIVLVFKALNARSKDDVDLENTLPLLDEPARAWLAATVAGLYPNHRWLRQFQ